MQTLYEGHDNTQIALLTAPAEVDKFLTQLERVAAELSWQPQDQIRASAGDALHIVGVVGSEIAGGLQLIVENENISLPCRKVWPEVQAGEGLAAHVTILALEQKYRGRPGLFLAPVRGAVALVPGRRCHYRLPRSNPGHDARLPAHGMAPGNRRRPAPSLG